MFYNIKQKNLAGIIKIFRDKKYYQYKDRIVN